MYNHYQDSTCVFFMREGSWLCQMRQKVVMPRAPVHKSGQGMLCMRTAKRNPTARELPSIESFKRRGWPTT